MLNLNLFFCLYDQKFFYKFFNFLRINIYIFNYIKFSETIKKRIILIKRRVLNNFNSKTKILLILNC